MLQTVAGRLRWLCELGHCLGFGCLAPYFPVIVGEALSLTTESPVVAIDDSAARLEAGRLGIAEVMVEQAAGKRVGDAAAIAACQLVDPAGWFEAPDESPGGGAAQVDGGNYGRVRLAAADSLGFVGAGTVVQTAAVVVAAAVVAAAAAAAAAAVAVEGSEY
jgi:hypothetical protein